MSSTPSIPKDLEIPPPPTSHHPYKPLAGAKGRIIYTETDEAPALATFSLLPILTKFAAMADVDIVPCDISLAGRVLSTFPEKLKRRQRVPDNLEYLGELCHQPSANIVKLPNISASIPQLEDCIRELRIKGYDIPLYPHEPQDDEDKSDKERFSKVLGSAVNPVLRQGNSDRHVAAAVKAHAMKNPIKMGAWNKKSKTHVVHMNKGDFYESEKSVSVPDVTDVAIELVGKDGTVKTLKGSLPLKPNEVIDASTMNVEELNKFYEREMQDAKETETLLSLHLKATMMKISDPIIFGHCVKVFFKDAFQKHGDKLEKIGCNPNNGLRELLNNIDKKLPSPEAAVIKKDFEACYEKRPWLAMVNSDKGITNLHVPSDIIIDNSMPTMIRDSGMMWNKINKLEETKCLIPDRSYATTYKEVVTYCKENGQFDPSTMGNICNVGLMAQKAEEYGSHDKTFEIPTEGVVRVRDKKTGKHYFEHNVSKGDIWRMCQTKDEAIQDWVKLAVDRARETGDKTIFWLDPQRGHDAVLIEKVQCYLKNHDLTNLDISIMKPVEAIRVSMERATKGLNTISVTGNVLRDYLTDLFPILELGTSSMVLSIVPLLAGGALYETGAGGSAPKHVQQFVESDHLRWNSLGEYMAMAEAFRRLGEKTDNNKSKVLGECLELAVGKMLERRKTPSRRVHEFDNRDEHFYLTLYWAEFLSEKDAAFKPVFDKLMKEKGDIMDEVKNIQGHHVDLGGYYLFDFEKAKHAMNASPTFNDILNSM